MFLNQNRKKEATCKQILPILTSRRERNLYTRRRSSSKEEGWWYYPEGTAGRPPSASHRSPVDPFTRHTLLLQTHHHRHHHHQPAPPHSSFTSPLGWMYLEGGQTQVYKFMCFSYGSNFPTCAFGSFWFFLCFELHLPTLYKV